MRWCFVRLARKLLESCNVLPSKLFLHLFSKRHAWQVVRNVSHTLFVNNKFITTQVYRGSSESVIMIAFSISQSCLSRHGNESSNHFEVWHLKRDLDERGFNGISSWIVLFISCCDRNRDVLSNMGHPWDSLRSSMPTSRNNSETMLKTNLPIAASLDQAFQFKRPWQEIIFRFESRTDTLSLISIGSISEKVFRKTFLVYWR